MKDEKVRDWMSKDLIIVDPDTALPQVYNLMTKHKIRRLPVLQYGKLVGIVTLGDIREARPYDANSLSIYKLNFLLSRLQVKQIMSANPITISPDATIGQAAKLMYEHKIGGLPVMDRDQLVGILTESDIFRLIAQGLEDNQDDLQPSQNTRKTRAYNPPSSQSNMMEYFPM